MDKGNRLRETRLSAGLTLQKVEELLGGERSFRQVARYELGDTPVPDELKVALARIYGVSVPFLFPSLDTRR